MIDKLFGALEDIYFTVISEPTPDDDESSNLQTFSNLELVPLIEEFKSLAKNEIYIGKSGNQFKLLKLATLFLNYIMYEDDGILSNDEKEMINSYIQSKLARLISTEKKELLEVFNIRIKLNEISQYILSHELPYRSIDMILDKLIDHTNNQPRYFQPLENLYTMLIESKI